MAQEAFPTHFRLGMDQFKMYICGSLWQPCVGNILMESPYPLRFEPVFRSYIWGGRRLQTVLEKQLPDDGHDYAESWEVVDHGEDQSVVSCGELMGKTLSELVRDRGEWLLGKHHPAPQFPLLFKFLDCQRKLSVQIHPDDEQGARLDPPDLGKTEAWVIMSAEPGSCLYAGLRPGIDLASLRQHIADGTVELALHQIHPKTGDCVFIPAGTVHALGDGLLVAEIQQSSNTTFRLFDWNRVDADGKSRPLHIEHGLAVVDFDRGPVEPVSPTATSENTERLVACNKFVLNRIRIDASATHELGGDDACHIVVVMAGELEIAGCRLKRGETTLLPASLGATQATASSHSQLLDIYLP